MSFPAIKLSLNNFSFTLPAVPNNEEHFVFSTRKAYFNYASKQLHYTALEDLYDPLRFSCPHVDTCNFNTQDPEKACLHSNRHSIVCTYNGVVHDWSFVYSAQNEQPKIRLINRQHLFSGRLFTLAKDAHKPVPVFEKAGKYVRVTYTFGKTPTTLIFSRSDAWTQAYLDKLKPFRTRFVGQAALFNGNFNFISLGPAKSLTALLTSAGLFTGPTLANLVLLCQTKDRFTAITCILNIVAMTGSLFANYAQIYNDTSAYSFFGQSAFTWVPSAATIILLLLFGTGKALEQHIPYAMSKALTLGTTLAGLNSISAIMQRTWTELFPTLYERYYGTPLLLDECLVASTRFTDLVKRLKAFEAEKGPDKLPTSKHHCDLVFSMHDELQEIYVDADIRKIKTYSPAVKSVERTIERWCSLARSSAHDAVRPRIEPVLIQLFGGSGIGKSTLVEVLTQDCLHDRIEWTGPDDIISNHIFTRNPGSAYWDGYNGQEALLLDDFMQLVDSPTAPSPEILDTIRIKNTAPFPLPMAELSLKARSYFKSKLVILTTNQKDFEAKSITYPQALQRRIDIKVMVDRPTQPKSALDTDPYIFTLYQNKVKVKSCNYDELVWLIREKLALREGNLDERNELLRQRRLSPRNMVPTQMDATWSRLIARCADTANEPPLIGRTSALDCVEQEDPDVKTKTLDACLKRLATGKYVSQGMCSTLEHGWNRCYSYFVGEDEHQATLRDLTSISKIDWFADIAATVVTAPLCLFSTILKWTIDNIHFVVGAAAGAAFTGLFYILAKIFVKGILKLTSTIADTMYEFIFGKSKMPELDKEHLNDATSLIAEGCTLENDPTMETFLEMHIYLNSLGLYPKARLEASPYSDFYCNLPTPSEWKKEHASTLDLDNVKQAINKPGFVEAWLDVWFPESSNPSGKQKSVKRGGVKGKVMKAEGMCDPSADGIIRKISKNMYKIVHTRAHYGVLTFIKGQVAIANKHVIREVKKHTEIVLEDKAGRQYRTPMNQVSVYYHSDIDLAFVVFPRTMRAHVSIVSSFVESEDLLSESMLLRGLFIRDGMFERISGRGKVTTRTVTVESSRPEDPDWEVRANQGLTYDGFETVAGDCGTLLTVIDPTMNKKILAMHTAGSVVNGLGFIITQEILETGLDAIPIAEQANYKLETIAEENEDYLTELPAPFEPTKTKLEATPLQTIFPPTKRPAVIRRIGDFDPMTRVVNLLKEPKVQLNDKQFQMVVDVNKHFFYRGERLLDRKLTLEEAVFGFEDIEPLAIKTSPGYPFMLANKPHGKAYWIDNIEKKIHPDLLDLIARREAELTSGQLSSPFIFKDSLKDEKRKLKHTDLENLSAVKTRVFSASPMDLTILLKMYFGSYFQHITRNRITNTATVGVNPYGMDWQLMVENLREVSPLADDGDYANFDTSESGSMLLAVLQAAIDWYDEPEHRIARQILARQIAFPVHLARGKLYTTDGGLPSGTFGTTHINCGVNLGVFMLSYNVITGHGIPDFSEKVRLLTHGDDNIFSVAPSRSEFTSSRIGEVASNFGFVYTPVAKDEVLSVARPIEECSFLKRGFKRIGKYWRAPLEKESCIEMMLWITRCKSPTLAMMDNVRTAMTELALTEPTGETREIVANYLKRCNLFEHLVTSDEQLQLYDDLYF